MAHYNDNKLIERFICPFLHNENMYESDGIQKINDITSRNLLYDNNYMCATIKVFTEFQMLHECNIFCDSPSIIDSYSHRHDCGYYSYGYQGNGFKICIGFCGNAKCIRVIQRQSLQKIIKFIYQSLPILRRLIAFKRRKNFILLHYGLKINTQKCKIKNTKYAIIVLLKWPVHINLFL